MIQLLRVSCQEEFSDFFDSIEPITVMLRPTGAQVRTDLGPIEKYDWPLGHRDRLGRSERPVKSRAARCAMDSRPAPWRAHTQTAWSCRDDQIQRDEAR
jgi:hypothetical protein